MKTKAFNNGLVVKHRKSAVIFEDLLGKDERETKFLYKFNYKEFEEFYEYLVEISKEAWGEVIPREAYSQGSDYCEYYDRKVDDNGYLELTTDTILITAPYWSKDTLFQFTKSKMESFLYDLLMKRQERCLR